MMRPIASRALRPVGRQLMRRGVRWLCRGVLRLLAIEVRAEGQLAAGPALLVANHLSWIDIVALTAFYDCTFVAKNEVRDWPLVGALGAWVPAFRAGHTDSARLIRGEAA